MGILDHLTCLLRNLYAGQQATVRTRNGTTDWFQIGKEYIKAVYCHPACLTYMQNTSYERPGWMKHKLESRSHREISTTSDMQMTPPLWWKVKKLNSLLKMKEESEIPGWKLDIQNTKIMAFGPITSEQIDGKHGQTIFLGVPKSLQMVTAAMKLKDSWSLE